VSKIYERYKLNVNFLRDLEKTGFHFFKTSVYKLHFFETASNNKFIITTDPDVPDLRDSLKSIHKNVFVEYVIKNPMYKLGETIKCELFIESVQKEIRSLPAFISRPKGIY
jgi:hypothetical protein